MSQPIPDDAAAAAAARTGDRAALDRLEQAVRPTLEDLAARLTLDPAAAPGLVRDVSVRAGLYLDRWPADVRFSAFVAGLALPQLSYHQPVDLRFAADRPEFSELPKWLGTPEQLGTAPHRVWLAFREQPVIYPALHLLHRFGLSEEETALVLGLDGDTWVATRAALRAACAAVDAELGPIGPAELSATQVFEQFVVLADGHGLAAPVAGARRVPRRALVVAAGAAAVLVGAVGGIQAFAGDDSPPTQVMGTAVERPSTTLATRGTLPPVNGGVPGPLAAAVGVAGTAGVSTEGTEAVVVVTTTTRRPAAAPGTTDTPAAPGTNGTTPATSTPGSGATTTTRAGTTTTTTRAGATTTSTTSTTSTSTTSTSTTSTSTTAPPTTTTSPPTTTTTSPPTTTTAPPTTTTSPPTTTTSPPTTTTAPPTTTTTSAPPTTTTAAPATDSGS